MKIKLSEDFKEEMRNNGKSEVFELVIGELDGIFEAEVGDYGNFDIITKEDTYEFYGYNCEIVED